MHFASSFREGYSLIEKHKDDIFVAIVDLNLPDAEDGEMASYLLEHNIPIVVLTNDYRDDTRDKLFDLRAIDYVTKESRYSYEYAINLIKRLEMNKNINILVTEDSKLHQIYIKELLKQHMHNVYTADNGLETLKVVETAPDIKLVLTDYNMPIMDGFELTRALRQKYDKTELIIIGLSGVENKTLSARFIKSGGNDFLCKPFIQEEFHCCITHNIETQEYLERIQE